MLEKLHNTTVAAEKLENQNVPQKSADEALDSASARIAERQFEHYKQSGTTIKIDQTKEKTAADSQKEEKTKVTAPPVVEQKPAKEQESPAMSTYKQFLIKDIEATKEEEKENLKQLEIEKLEE